MGFTRTTRHTTYPFISPTRPELSAAGKNVVVTGGGSGIGLAVATGFTEAGPKSVTIIGRSVERLQKGVAEIKAAVSGTSTEILYQSADITNPAQLEAAFSDIVYKVGKVDILVANASGAEGSLGKLTDIDPNTLTQVLQVDATGALNVFRAFFAAAAPNATILHTSSSSAHLPSVPYAGVYIVAKAAALRLWQQVAEEHPELRIIHIQPGYIPTSLNGYAKDATDTVDLPRHFYVWLASSEANFLRNKLVWATWDAEELVQRADEIANSRLLTTGLDGAWEYPTE